MSEFELITRLQNIINDGRPGLTQAGSIGIGDDAAVISVADGQSLLVTTDTLVSGCIFPQTLMPLTLVTSTCGQSE